jgi:hypothetical protein
MSNTSQDAKPHQLNFFEKYIEPFMMAEGSVILSDILADPNKKKTARKVLREMRDMLNAASLD